jgi:thiamine biosynthesis lipoprotein
LTASIRFNRRAFLAMSLALVACKNRLQIIEVQGISMGTTYNVAAVDPGGNIDKRALSGAIDLALQTVSLKLSNWDGGSEISALNAGSVRESVVMSGELAAVMNAAAQVHTASEGRFDTTIGGLIELWGFGADGTRGVPNSDAIAQALEASGHGKTLEMGAGKIEKLHEDAQIYLAGIGKGFGADQIAQVLQSFGLDNYMVEIGGDLVTAGHNPDGLPWQIGIESPNPADRALSGVVGLGNKGLATSGDYRNYFEFDGARYSHLIDPTTGRPVSHATTSATVISENAMMADAWSTAMHILGREHGLEIAQRHGIAVQFIERGSANTPFTTHVSPAFADLTA